MPGSYPPAPPTISQNLVTVHQLLQSPRRIERALRRLADLRFVSDEILTRELRSAGGAVLYETGEAITNEREVEAVAPGAEYPRDTPGTGTASMAAVKKWGQAVFLSDEKIKRSVYAGQEVDRAFRKLINTVISKIDGLTTAAVASAVTATHEAIAPWSADADARMWRDIEMAAAEVVDLNQGFNPDTVLMSTEKGALLMTDRVVAEFRRREDAANPVYNSMFPRIGKYRIVTTSTGNLPSDDVWVFDSQQLGGMADETELDPGYARSEQGVQVQTERIKGRDGWDLWARRLTVPVVLEPASAIRITDTEAS